MIDENVTRAFNNFLKRISSINDDWYDEIELQLLCADIFGKTGTLICCRVELDHKSIYDVGFENLTQTTRKKLQGDLNIKRLMESPEFTTHPIRVGRDLLVGNSSVWLIRYTRFDKNPSFFYGVSVDPEKDKELVESLVDFKKFTKEKDQVFILQYNSRQGFYCSPYDTPSVDIDVNMLYNDDLPYEEILEGIRDRSYGGIFLFHGEPGTGKTTFLRHLIQKSRDENHRMIIIPNCYIQQIGSPEFLQFCLSQTENVICILEDSEDILHSREYHKGNSVLSDLLNLGDGIIGYISNVKFICTFNTSERNIDSALLREGRLRVMYEFKKLSLDKTRAFIPNATEPMTLAKIFKAKKTFRQEMKEKKVGYL